MPNQYTIDLHQYFKPLFAAWPLEQNIILGEYGILDEQSYLYTKSNISVKNLDVDFKEIIDPTTSHRSFISVESSQTQTAASGENPLVRGLLEVSFSAKNSIFFNAANCRLNSIENKVALGKDLITKYLKGKWDINHVVVTDVLVSEATTIAISNTDSSQIRFSANQYPIRLSDASVSLSVISENGIVDKCDTAAGMTPLFGLCKIEKTIFGELQFNQLGAGDAPPIFYFKPD